MVLVENIWKLIIFWYISLGTRDYNPLRIIIINIYPNRENQEGYYFQLILIFHIQLKLIKPHSIVVNWSHQRENQLVWSKLIWLQMQQDNLVHWLLTGVQLMKLGFLHPDQLSIWNQNIQTVETINNWIYSLQSILDNLLYWELMIKHFIRLTKRIFFKISQWLLCTESSLQFHVLDVLWSYITSYTRFLFQT